MISLNQRRGRRLRTLAATSLVIASASAVIVPAATAAAFIPSLRRTAAPEPQPMSYSQAVALAARRDVTSALINVPAAQMILTKRGGGSYLVGLPSASNTAAAVMSAGGANVQISETKSSGGGVPGWVQSLLMMVGIFLIIAVVNAVRQQRSAASGGGMMGRAGGLQQRETVVTERPTVRFANVAGCDEAVEEMQEIVDILKDPERYARIGAVAPAGAITHGPPGTGKTLLARATAGEAGCAFMRVSGSEFVEMFVGVGARRMRSLFETARKNAPCIVFIDEIDAIGGRRGSGGMGGANEEREATLNQLLVELDGFDRSHLVFVLAATNRPESLDPALVRKGRLDRDIHVGLPDEPGRLEILKVHARGKPFAADVDLSLLARQTAGFSGATLESVLNEAALWAARQHHAMISADDLSEGLLRAIAGPRKKASPASADELRRIAYHEAGHVLAAELCETHDNAQRATIEPRGQALGLALYGRADRALLSRQHCHEQLIAMLAGRAAEQVVFGEIYSGAANDLDRANELVRTAVTKWGFSAQVGHLVDATSGYRVQVSEQTLGRVDEACQEILDEAYRDTAHLLTSHRDQLNRLAESLLTHRDINRERIETALGTADPANRTPRSAIGWHATDTVPTIAAHEIVTRRQTGVTRAGIRGVLGRRSGLRQRRVKGGSESLAATSAETYQG